MNIKLEKHEKAIIMLAAYVIGFTTAYISFGIGNDIEQKNDYIAVYSVVDEVATDNSIEVNESESSTLEETESGLMFKKGDYERLVTVNKAALIASGFNAEDYGYVSLVDYKISPDKKYVYYCEQETQDDYCSPYVYSPTLDVIYPVSFVEGNKVDLLEYSAEWRDDGVLVISGDSSSDPESPWL